MTPQEIYSISKAAKLCRIIAEGLKEEQATVIRLRSWPEDIVEEAEQLVYQEALADDMYTAIYLETNEVADMPEEVFTTIEKAVEGYTVTDAIANLQQLGLTREAKKLADFARSCAEDFNLDEKAEELIADRFYDEISRWETAMCTLYAEKTMTLAPHTPAAIHVINKRMYWYYEIDGWKFHSPIPEEQTSAELRKFAAHQIEPRELNDFTPLNVAISDAELLPLINRFGSMTIERINELREKWQEREERFATRHARNEYHNGEDDEI